MKSFKPKFGAFREQKSEGNKEKMIAFFQQNVSLIKPPQTRITVVTISIVTTTT